MAIGLDIGYIVSIVSDISPPCRLRLHHSTPSVQSLEMRNSHGNFSFGSNR